MNDRPDAALYVYYRLPSAARWQAQTELAAAHAALQATWPRLSSRVLQKSDAESAAAIRDEMLTWMEIHHQPGGLDTSTIASICEMLAPWPSARVGARHVEVFATLPASGAL
ncbi:DUF4936 family protein [Sphaerotilus sp.]|jgi:Domain of unknown function (DUF4936)|uniref:DUF4936 family protein n=1 Tax=Sphaerotilus sp. TaxID=2093942 RepID=UPI0026004C83|nr:DUF4936 family protein [Sphaerotilus sp.]